MVWLISQMQSEKEVQFRSVVSYYLHSQCVWNMSPISASLVWLKSSISGSTSPANFHYSTTKRNYSPSRWALTPLDSIRDCLMVVDLFLGWRPFWERFVQEIETLNSVTSLGWRPFLGWMLLPLINNTSERVTSIWPVSGLRRGTKNYLYPIHITKGLD